MSILNLRFPMFNAVIAGELLEFRHQRQCSLSFFSFNTRLNCLDEVKEGVIVLIAFPIDIFYGAIKGNGTGHDDRRWQGQWPHIGWRIADCVSTIFVGELLLLAKTVQYLAAGILHPQIALKQGSQ